MSDVEEKLRSVLEDHIGFAADEYLERQWDKEFDKDISEIQEKDLDPLIEWIDRTAPLVIDDDEEIAALKEDLQDIR